MLSYVARRLLVLVPVMWIVATVVFLLLHSAPGDPAAFMLGSDATVQQQKQLDHMLGLDKPLGTQYVDWLGKSLQGNLGESIFLGQSVDSALASHAVPTLELGFVALVVALVIGLVTGVICAVRRATWVDLSLMAGAMTGVAIPTFVIGLLLIYIFAVKLRLLPVAGYQPLSAGLWPCFRYLILPGITLGAFEAAFLSRMTRSMMLEVMGEDYVRTARAKGLAEHTVMLRHTLRNAFVPLLTIIGLMVAGLMSGAVVTEQIFDIPGMGNLLITAVVRRDFPVVQGAVLVIALIYVLINLGVDLLAKVIDPRIEL